MKVHSSTITVASQNSFSAATTLSVTGLPTGDHPTEQVLVKDGWIYWSQGSATNAGVTGHDNGAGGNQHDIPCQDITLSNELFDSGDGHLTSGFSNHGVQRPGAIVPAFVLFAPAGFAQDSLLGADALATESGRFRLKVEMKMNARSSTAVEFPVANLFIER